MFNWLDNPQDMIFELREMENLVKIKFGIKMAARI